MDKLGHFSQDGSPQMVDISDKAPSARMAVAEGTLTITPAHAAALSSLPKGDAFTTAKLAGIQAAKRCSELIPLCHQIPLTRVEVGFRVEGNFIRILAETKTQASTGVEMEAYTAVAVAGLALIDMLKGVNPDLVLGDIRLLSKSGGKADYSRNG